MSNRKNHIEKLTPELMQQYLDGQLSEAQRHSVEKYMLDNEFEAEAMDGFDEISTTELQSDLSILQSKLNEKNRSTKPKFSLFLKVAASIIFLAVCSYLSIQLFKEPINNEETLALSPLEDENNYEDKMDMPDSQPEKNDILEEEIENEETAPIQEQETKSTTRSNKVKNLQVPKNEVLSQPAQEPTNLSSIEIEAETDEEILADNIELDVPEKSMADRMENDISNEHIGMASKSMKKATVPQKMAMKQAEVKEHNTLTGRVKSAEDGSPLSGVNVIVKNTNTGVVTDTDGKYEITLPSDTDSTLVFSFIGLASKEVNADGKVELDVFLDADVQQLSEVVTTRSAENEVDSEQTFTVAKPVISKSAYKTYLNSNVIYPKNSESIKGKVIVKFKVNANGKLSDFEITKSLGTAYNQEAIRLIKEGPKWFPAEKDGKSVEDRVKVTVRFEY